MRILATLAVLATVAVVPSSANAVAAQSTRGAERDRAATMPTDVSARRRVYRYGYRYYPYAYWGPYVGAYPQRAYAYGSYRPYPYAYREWYWGPRLFPYGSWW